MTKKQQAEFTDWMGPILDALRNLGGSGTPHEVTNSIAEALNISSSKKEELTSSGQKRFKNQVAWARQYLVWEGYLESSKRGIWTLSSTGTNKRISSEEGRRIFLKWVDIYSKRRKEDKKVQTDQTSIQEETIVEETTKQEDRNYREELLDLLRSLSPRGFEELCLLLLRENGFENLTLTSRGRDGGIDGMSILRINPFVSFKVLFQCKRYSARNPVKREQIGDFRNAMLGRADKGIFITTGYYSADAEKEANREGAIPIELVDCEKLIDMFEKSELGLTPVKSYEIEKNFFEKYIDLN